MLTVLRQTLSPALIVALWQSKRFVKVPLAKTTFDGVEMGSIGLFCDIVSSMIVASATSSLAVAQRSCSFTAGLILFGAF